MARKVTQEEIEEAKRTGNFVDGTQGLNSDWIRAGRLIAKAEAGDKEAARKLEEMKNIMMVPEDTL